MTHGLDRPRADHGRAPATVGELLGEAKGRLRAAPFAPAPREAHLLLGHVLGLGEARLLARATDPVPAACEAAFRALLERRLTGEPFAYLVGEREFYGRPFRVDRRVLVPRPETEHLVESVLEASPSLPDDARVLDVGAGSGAIAVTLTLERPRWRVTATDLSPAALAVARENARRHGLSDDGPSPRLRLVACDLASALRPERYDLLVSNPPYVPEEELAGLSPEVRDFEPYAALVSPAGETGSGEPAPGMGIASLLLEQAAALPPTARVVLEIGHGQLDGLAAVARRHGWRVARSIPDYAGIPRVVWLDRRG